MNVDSKNIRQIQQAKITYTKFSLTNKLENHLKKTQHTKTQYTNYL